MSKSKELFPKPHAYLVAGGGGGLRSTIVLRLITEELTARDVDFTCVDGLYTDDEGEQSVRYPSLQLEYIKNDVEKRPDNTPLLFIAHCIGTIAALTAAEQYETDRPVSLVSIAPPLPCPRTTIMRPQSQSKRSANNTRMRTVDLPPGAINYSDMTEGEAKIDPQYFMDIDGAYDVQPRLRDKVAEGCAAVYAPEYDWNQDSPVCVNTWNDEWKASRSADEAAQLRSRAVVIPGAAHGLYLSPRSGLDVTDEENIVYQTQNVEKLVDIGINTLSEDRIIAGEPLHR